MSQLLTDKERLIQEAITMVDEVKKSNDALRERSEQLLKEKIAAQGVSWNAVCMMVYA